MQPPKVQVQEEAKSPDAARKAHQKDDNKD
jgi:hypothetical protein